MHQPHRSSDAIAAAQGAFYIATGVWPLVHMPSFEAVTGAKVDRWLVRTVGGLIGVIGGALLSAGLRERVTPEIRALGAGSAAVLTAIDITYVARRRIPPVYLLDAAAEIALVLAWSAPSSGSAAAPSQINGPTRELP